MTYETTGQTGATKSIECPRCGYELCGLRISTEANDAGKCPECGYEFVWSVLLDPLFSAPRWFVELGTDKLILNSLRTTVRSLLPWKFWRAVQMELPRNHCRAIAAVIIGFVAIWISLAICGAARIVVFELTSNPYRQNLAIRFIDEMNWRPLHAMVRLLSPANIGLWGSGWLWGTYIAYACAPFSLLLAPRTLHKARVLPGHVVRIVIYSMAPMLVLVTIPSVVRSVWWMIQVIGFGYYYSSDGAKFIFDNNWWLRPSLAFIAIVLTWGFACSRYLKLPHPWLVAAAIGAISTLIGAVVTVLMFEPLYLF